MSGDMLMSAWHIILHFVIDWVCMRRRGVEHAKFLSENGGHMIQRTLQ
jgi:hypothetical protein